MIEKHKTIFITSSRKGGFFYQFYIMLEKGKWPKPILQNEARKARVALRAPWGQLGIRVAGALVQNPDIELTAGVVHHGKTVSLRGKALLEQHPNIGLYVVEDDADDIEQFERDGFNVKVWHDNLFDKIDLIIDCTSPDYGKEFPYRAVANDTPVIIQSGRGDTGRLLVPPRIDGGNGRIFQMGECNINALTPVLNALEGIIEGVKANILMQYSSHWRGRIRDENLEATYFRSGDRLLRKLQTLFPDLDLDISDIAMVIGKRWYSHQLKIYTTDPVDAGEIIQVLNRYPRIRCFPDARNTHSVREYSNSLQAFGMELPPIIPMFIRGGTPFDKKRDVRMVLAVDSRRITVGPNVDAADILLFGTDPVEAMRRTDKTLNYASQPPHSSINTL